MNYWLFVIKADISVFKERIEANKWPIYDKTSFRKNLEVGDYIIFYMAGYHEGQKFLGNARIAELPSKIKGTLTYNLSIKDADVWPERPSIRDYLTKLSFIKNDFNWGIYLQGGVKRLTKKEYSMLKRKAERMKNQD